MIGTVALCLAAAGCVQTTALLRQDRLSDGAARSTVLLLPPDIEIAEVIASGEEIANAAWTAQARASFDQAIDGVLDDVGSTPVRYSSANGAADYDDRDLQAVKLHGTVGATIIIHKYIAPMALPTKKGKFDWSLGDTVRSMGQRYEADYGIFVYLRDSFSSEGRVALQVFGALLGAGVQGGYQSGFASLVDLRTGDIIWFNILSRQTGDLRKPDSAREALDILFQGFPL